MGKCATTAARLGATTCFTLCLYALCLTFVGQDAGAQTLANWRQVGTWVIEKSLAGPAGGPVARVWYSADGGTLYAQTAGGGVFQLTGDAARWQIAPTASVPARALNFSVANLPEVGAQVRAVAGIRGRLYAFGDFVYRSDNGGLDWENKTVYQGKSMVGSPVLDLAVGASDEMTVATGAGVFRSMDGGTSWSSLNDSLPNFPAVRLLSLPFGSQGVRVALDHDEAAQWEPGQKAAWTPASNLEIANETALRGALSQLFSANVTAAAIAGDFIYAGTQAGVVFVSMDRGATWRNNASYAGPVERFWIDPNDPRIALAAQGAAPLDVFRSAPPPHVIHTLNGGAFWDDITGNLPNGAAHGISADRASNAVYVATDQGVFLSYTDLGSLTTATWSKLDLESTAKARDVKLDAQGNQLWVALEGYGVYATLAPHRLRDPKVVSSADMVTHALAPGSLISILGAKVDSVRAGNSAAPVLASSAGGSEVQIPFDVRGTTLALSASAGGVNLPLASQALTTASPVIFVAADGSPLLLNADEGTLLDAANPAHSGTRIQILATGLGRVTPEWPAGVAAPLSNPPSVIGTVHALLDRVAVNVTSATLAPGYVGFYLVEIEVPKTVNFGPAELLIDVGGARSNAVRVYVEQ